MTNLQQRERLLAVGFAAVIGVFVVIPWLWGKYTGPIDEANDNLEKAQKKLDTAQISQIAALKKRGQLKTWQGRSLSSQPQEASRQYQQWVNDLAEEVAQFSRLQVTPQAVSNNKGAVFNTVKLQLNGEGTLAQLRLFLFRFSQADLMHAITSMTVESPSATGNPQLSIKMQLEALSISKAPPRGPTVFARTKLAEKWTAGSDTLRVESTERFPTKAPFVIRMGSAYFDVTKLDGRSWTIQPEANFAASNKPLSNLPADQTVELVPIHPDFAKRRLADFDPILRNNVFLKPIPYAPKLEFVGTTVVSRGGSLSLTCQASGFDQSLGAPSFTIGGEPPKGLILDGSTGKLTWKPDSEQPLGDISLTVTANAPGLKEPLTKPLKLLLKQTNKTPKLDRIGERHAVLGREFKFTVKATDDDSEPMSLRFSLGNGAPPGAKIDATSGEFVWMPPETTVPGPVKVTVQVADDGNPPGTDSQEFTITVGDDLAQFTQLTSIIEIDGRKEFWLSDKSTNRLLKLHEGETLNYADIEAKVARIERKFVLFEKNDATWRLNLGDNLKSLQKLE